MIKTALPALFRVPFPREQFPPKNLDIFLEIAYNDSAMETLLWKRAICWRGVIRGLASLFFALFRRSAIYLPILLFTFGVFTE